MAIFSLILLPVSLYIVFSDLEKYFPYPEVVAIIKIGIVMFLFNFFIYLAFVRGNKTKKDNTDSSEKNSERTLIESKEDWFLITGAAGTVIGSQLTKNNDDSAAEKVESSYIAVDDHNDFTDF